MSIIEIKNYSDLKKGFTWEDALRKKTKLDDAYEVENPNSEFLPAEIIEDTQRDFGYKVIVRTKEEN